MPYGVVRALVLAAQGQRSLCIGIMHDTGKTEILPAHDLSTTLSVDDRLVILRRELP